MRGSKDRIGRSRLHGALGISAVALLSGCGWFGDSTPADMAKLRPGVERDVSPSAALPPPPANQQYDPPISPVDDTRNAPQIGSIVAASGGQKAQLEKQEKEETTRDEQERATQEKADKAAKEAEDAAKAAGPNKQATTAGDKSGEPPTQPVAPPRGPVTATPVPPPDTALPVPPATPPATDTTPPAPPPSPSSGTKPAGT